MQQNTMSHVGDGDAGQNNQRTDHETFGPTFEDEAIGVSDFVDKSLDNSRGLMRKDRTHFRCTLYKNVENTMEQLLLENETRAGRR